MAKSKIEVTILGDSSSVEKAFKKAGSSADTFNAKLGKSSAGLSRLAKSAALATGALIGGVAVLVAKGVQSASNLEEQINKTNVVFGKSADGIKTWAKTTAAALGLSERAALEAAGGYGQMLQTAGLTEKQSAKFSKRLTGLAADMASFNNIDPSEALLKLKSGLAGEAEPLRTVGVLLSEARVKQEAYASGIAAAGSELTEGQKVQARYNLILKDTAKQQGDFARTSDSFANSLRIVKAQFENISAQVGSVFLPVVAKVTSGFAKFLGKLAEAKTTRAKLGVVLETGRDIGSQALNLARDIQNQVLSVLGSINWRNAGRIVGDGLSKGLQAVSAFLQRVDWGKAGGTIARGLINFLKGVPWGSLLKQIGVLIFRAIVALNSFLYTAAKELGKAIMEGISAGAEAFRHLVGREIKKLPQRLTALGGLLLGAGKKLGKKIIDGVGEGIDTATDFVLQKLLKFVDKVLGVTGFLGRFDPFKGLRDGVKKRLAEMESDTKTSVDKVQKTVDGVKDSEVNVTVNTKTKKDGKDKGTVASAASNVPTVDLEKAAKEKADRLAKITAAFEEAMSFLSNRMTEAESTKSFQDDLAVLTKQERLIAQQIKVVGRTADLESQLLAISIRRKEIRKDIREAAATRRQDNQFKKLGLGAGGEERTPGVAALKKRAASLKDQVKGTVLDTPKTAGQLAKIAAVLSGKFGKVGKEVREAILQMLNDISGALDSGEKKGPLTKTSGLNTFKVTAGLGLTPEQERALRSRLSGFNSAGLALAGGDTGPTGDFVVHQTINIDGAKVAGSVTRHQQKGRRRNPRQKRGPNRTGGV